MRHKDDACMDYDKYTKIKIFFQCVRWNAGEDQQEKKLSDIEWMPERGKEV